MWTITLNAYQPAIDRFVVIQMQFDFSMTGVITPGQIKIIVFSLDQLKQTSRDALIIDGLQVFFCMVYLYRACFIKIIYGDELKDKDGNNPLGYSPSCSIFTDILVLFFFVAKFLMSQITNYQPVDEILLDEEHYIDLVRFADFFLQQYQQYSFIIMCNMFNLINSIRIFRLVDWIMSIIE